LVVQSQAALNLSAGPGVAVREFTLEKPHGRVDYLLFVGAKPAGVIDESAGLPAAVHLRVHRCRDALYQRV
jgi:hypothetical protein